jgi:hypothetical protein
MNSHPSPSPSRQAGSSDNGIPDLAPAALKGHIMTKTAKPLPIMLDRFAHILAKHGFQTTRSAHLQILAATLGYRNSNELAAAQKSGTLVLPTATLAHDQTVELPSGEELLILRDPLANAPFAIDLNFITQISSTDRRETAVPTPYGHLVSLDDALNCVTPNSATKLKPYQKFENAKHALSCPATLKSDDQKQIAQFDAQAWFQAESDDAIIELADEDWRDGYTADDVARYFENNAAYPQIDAVFEYIHIHNQNCSKRDIIGFSVSVDKDAAINYLKTERPAVYARLMESNGEYEIASASTELSTATEANAANLNTTTNDFKAIVATTIITGLRLYAGLRVPANLDIIDIATNGGEFTEPDDDYLRDLANKLQSGQIRLFGGSEDNQIDDLVAILDDEHHESKSLQDLSAVLAALRLLQLDIARYPHAYALQRSLGENYIDQLCEDLNTQEIALITYNPKFYLDSRNTKMAVTRYGDTIKELLNQTINNLSERKLSDPTNRAILNNMSRMPEPAFKTLNTLPPALSFYDGVKPRRNKATESHTMTTILDFIELAKHVHDQTPARKISGVVAAEAFDRITMLLEVCDNLIGYHQAVLRTL